MTTQSKSAQNSEQTRAPAPTEQTQAELLNDLKRDVTALGDRENLSDHETLIKELLKNITDCDDLAATYQKLQAVVFYCPVESDQTKTRKTPKNPRTLAEIIKEQNQQRGLEPLVLESDLLLKRVADGGHSGQFLADAFISAYRTNQPFQHSLGELNRLDTEAFRLFHQVLHIRHIQGWNDNTLYKIEQQINALVGGVA